MGAVGADAAGVVAVTITEFLLARIAEDEAAVKGLWQGEDPDFFWGPDRIRAECEAKRRIVEFCDDPHADSYERGPVLNLLALPYAEHPDYREEWKL